MIRSVFRPLSPLCLVLALAALLTFTIDAEASDGPGLPAAAPSRIDHWQPRFGRTRPIVAVVGENSGTELVDFMIPYGVLADSGVVDVIALGTESGPIQMRPALRVQPQRTLSGFDDDQPLGADYVIVPAFTQDKAHDPALIAWLRAQSAKGAMVVSICDGALVVANAGLFEGHRATGHWATQGQRESEHPGTQWLHNVRYVADGNVMSSAGVSAAIPTSLALVEAIGGADLARQVATRLGTSAWSDRHDSDRFGIGAETVFTYVGNRYLKGTEQFVIPVADAVDDIALALTMDAYGRTMRGRVSIRSASGAPVRTSHGLVLLPLEPADARPLRELVIPEGPSLTALDKALSDIGQRYGMATERYVELEMEYAAAESR